MNNLKKIGLSALAGTLASLSAQAGEMSVTGTAEISYVQRDSNEITGNPLGTLLGLPSLPQILSSPVSACKKETISNTSLTKNTLKSIMIYPPHRSYKHGQYSKIQYNRAPICQERRKYDWKVVRAYQRNS